MGKKEKRKSRKQASANSSQGDRDRQRREQQASSQDDSPRREEPIQHEEPPQREQNQPTCQEEVSREQQPLRGEELQQPSHHEEFQMEEKPEQPTSGKGTKQSDNSVQGDGELQRRGPQQIYQWPQRRKQQASSNDESEIKEQPIRHEEEQKQQTHHEEFAREQPLEEKLQPLSHQGKQQMEEKTKLHTSGASKAEKDDIHPELTVPIAAKLEVLEEEELLSKAVGLSLEQTSPIKFNIAKRPNYGTIGRRIGLFVNYFKLEFKDTYIYHYDIDILYSTKDEDIGKSFMATGRTAKKDIKKGVKHIERQKRRNIGIAKCREIISGMIKLKSLQPFCPVYDGQKNLFTNKPLPYIKKDSFPIDVLIDGRDQKFYITIQPVEKQDGSNRIDLQPLFDLYNNRSTEIPLEVLLVYETVMNHRDPPLEEVQFRNSFFSLNSGNKPYLGNGLDIWFGYNQSVHLTELSPVLVINVAAKAFHKAGSVLDYANDVVGRDISNLPRLENWHIKELNNALKGVYVKVTYQRFPRKYKIKGLSDCSAREQKFQDGNREIYVTQYFQEKYNVRLSYPHLPCLHMQTSNNNTYIPIEKCEIVEGQPKIGKLSGNLTSNMIKSTAVPPKQRFESIRDIAKKIKDTSKNFMDAFGLIMDINLLKVDGRILAAPKLKYNSKNATTPDKSGVWRIEDGIQFYRVVNIKKWILISFADEKRFGTNVLSNYCELLVKSANKCGMQMGRPTSINIRRNVSTEKAIVEAKTAGVDFAIIVLNRNDEKHTYDEVKFLSDFKYRLVTQCMEDQTLGRRLNDQITTNVCLKINVKLGGINHVLLQNPQIFSKPVMVIGADAIHWTRGLGYPSIVSVVASLNAFATRYALTCYPQRNERKGKISQEIIQDMKGIAEELLKVFELETKKFPQKIIVFRDGVSEGQFQHVIDYEVSGIQQACIALKKPVVPITFIVVQKRHQTRFYPQNPAEGVGKCQNIPPGTVVDKDISHPVFFDFFVCSHEGIQGTSKPAHYTVLHDDNKFQANELQELCHFLCHTYVRCTRSVSLPAPVLYAHLAAYRAKKYADLFIKLDDVSISSFDEDVQREFPRNVLDAILSMKSFENKMFYV